ncbi:MAG: P-loop NTPase fold protein [Acinetobacter sp.]
MSELSQLNWEKVNLDNIENAWEGDLWERKRLGIQLTNYVDRLQCGAVLALDARWGEGKTWFVRHWQKHLENENHNVIYLDAFANDYLEDPFLVIASEIASKLDQTADKGLVYKFKKAAAVMQQGLLTQAPTIIASMISFALTGGIIPFLKVDNDSMQEKFEDIVDKVTDNIGEKVTEAIQKKIDDYEEEKQSLTAFKETLATLAESLDKPLVFIIDELDRCRPDFAIRLIERIKHFFDIPKIVFILVMDKAQFSKVICHNYGYDETLSGQYLGKFIDFEVPLKNAVHISVNTPSNFKLIHKLLGDIGEKSDDIAFVFLLNPGVNMTARELKRKINLYALLKKNQIEKDIFIALGISNMHLDLLREMKDIALKIKKMESGSENITKVDMAHFNAYNFRDIVEQKFNIIPNGIINYLTELSVVEKFKQTAAYNLKFKEFLEKYALHPNSEMKNHVFQSQYQKYLTENVWLED